jgi:hypothetical protein
MGFAFGSGNTSSGFGGLGSGSVFGSALGNGFAGGSGPKLSSFAAPVKETPAETKPLKAFGAPDSDEDEGSDEEDSEGGTDSDEEEGVRLSPEEKRKTKNVKGLSAMIFPKKLVTNYSSSRGWGIERSNIAINASQTFCTHL